MASRSKPAPANRIFLFDMRESLPEEYEYEVNVIARAVGRDVNVETQLEAISLLHNVIASRSSLAPPARAGVAKQSPNSRRLLPEGSQ